MEHGPSRKALGPGKSPYGPRPASPARPPAAANTRRSGLSSRVKPGRLGRGLGMLGSPEARGGKSEAFAPARQRPGQQLRTGREQEGPVGAGCSPLATGRQARERATGVQSPDAAQPRIAFRGGGFGERNSGAAATPVQVSRGAGVESWPVGGRGQIARGCRGSGPDLAERLAGGQAARGEGA
jgi:hypothetical protein